MFGNAQFQIDRLKNMKNDIDEQINRMQMAAVPAIQQTFVQSNPTNGDFIGVWVDNYKDAKNKKFDNY